MPLLKTLIYKELRSILYSPKFPATFAICSVLIILSVLFGIWEYRISEKQYRVGQQSADTQLHEQSNWPSMHLKAFRKPDPMQIFVSGITFDLGRWSYLEEDRAINLQGSVYSENPVLAVFRLVDFSFIVLIILSLLSVVFTYDAICGERESGTLRLVFSHAISRAQYLFAKCAGAWLGLLVPLAIPVLISLLLILIFDIPFSGFDWVRLILFLCMVVLFLTFFIVFSILMSTLAKRSSISFVISLVCWVLFVFIIPRIGVIVANQVVKTPTIAEIEGKRSTYVRDQWQQYPANFIAAERKFYENHPEPTRQQVDSLDLSLQADIIRLIQEYENKLLDDQRRAQNAQQKLAFTLCMFSPASVFQLASMTLAGTDIALKQRYEEAMNHFHLDFKAYLDKKHLDAPGIDPMSVVYDGVGGLHVVFPYKKNTHLNDLPRLVPPIQSIGAILSRISVDVGLMICLILGAFAGSWVMFMRYDLR